MYLSHNLLLIGLCLIMALLGFKPSEPYLSNYLVCNKSTNIDICNSKTSSSSCSEETVCIWTEISAATDGSTSSYSCELKECSSLDVDTCNDDDYNYCIVDGHTCIDDECYKSFTIDEVNNEIYTVAVYAYLPLLLLLGCVAEIFSYRSAILLGIMGRVVTRFLLLYSDSLTEMQIMQVAYSSGTAAEDIYMAFVLKVLPLSYYQTATSLVKTSGHISHMTSGILGDILVAQLGTSLTTLFIISTVSVSLAFLLSLFIIVPVEGAKLTNMNNSDANFDDNNNGNKNNFFGMTHTNTTGVNVVNPLLDTSSTTTINTCRNGVYTKVSSDEPIKDGHHLLEEGSDLPRDTNGRLKTIYNQPLNDMNSEYQHEHHKHRRDGGGANVANHASHALDPDLANSTGYNYHFNYTFRRYKTQEGSLPSFGSGYLPTTNVKNEPLSVTLRYQFQIMLVAYFGEETVGNPQAYDNNNNNHNNEYYNTNKDHHLKNDKNIHSVESPLLNPAYTTFAHGNGNPNPVYVQGNDMSGILPRPNPNVSSSHSSNSLSNSSGSSGDSGDSDTGIVDKIHDRNEQLSLPSQILEKRNVTNIHSDNKEVRTNGVRVNHDLFSAPSQLRGGVGAIIDEPSTNTTSNIVSPLIDGDADLVRVAALWCLGNACFMTLYNYEISIYMDMNNGSDKWNGSVMAVMLLLGSAGAALPALKYVNTLLNGDSDLDNNNDNNDDDEDDDEDARIKRKSNKASIHGVDVDVGVGRINKRKKRTARKVVVTIVAVIAAVILLLFVAAWSVIVSCASLALFFMCWNFITVVFYAWLGTAVNETQVLYNQRQLEQQQKQMQLQLEYYEGRRKDSTGINDSDPDGSIVGLPINLGDAEDAADMSLHQTRNSSSSTSFIRSNSQYSVAPQRGFTRTQRQAPFSVAIVTMVAISALLQVVLTSTLFSGLQMTVHSASWLICVVYAGAAALYLLANLSDVMVMISKRCCRTNIDR